MGKRDPGIASAGWDCLVGGLWRSEVSSTMHAIVIVRDNEKRLKGSIADQDGSPNFSEMIRVIHARESNNEGS